ncbi:MAG: hypothetical protein IT337_13840 [Thermomicrobiales bacterium]|nr:hypothetical protein [Thermomicrobiales bacterium]
MDGGQFDRLTRSLARRTGRRGVLSVAAAGGIAALLARRRTSLAAQERDDNCPNDCPKGQTCVGGVCVERCRQDKECRPEDGDACIGGRCADGVCSQFVADCEPGYVCCGNGECCAQSCRLDLDCTLADPCIVGRCEEGICAYAKRDPCVRCGSDADCSSEGFCCGGTCLRPCPQGTRLTKGCECLVVASGGMNADGITITDEAAGSDNQHPSDSGVNPGSDGAVVTEAPPSSTITSPPNVSTGAPDSTEETPAAEGEPVA